MIFACQLTKEACRRTPQCEPHLPCWLAQRFAKLLSQLSDPSKVGMAVTTMNQMLAAEKLSFSDIANALEEQRYSAVDMQYALNKGKEIASREVGNQQQNTALEFFDGNGEPRWYEIALFCRDNVGRLRNDREKEFVNDMPGKMLQYAAPTGPQAKWLLSIFVKLGGHCAPDIQARYFQR